MSHVSPSVNSSYPLRGTMLRLDSNGDGVLSREELAADQRPGLLATDAKDGAKDYSQGSRSNLIAKLFQLPSSLTDVNATDQTQSAAPTSDDDDVDTQPTTDFYSSTYGQYDVDDMAA